VMNSLAPNSLDDHAIVFAQMQLCLAHDYTYERRMATSEVQSCSVNYVLLYYFGTTRQISPPSVAMYRLPSGPCTSER
jgi:hypothetical protein